MGCLPETLDTNTSSDGGRGIGERVTQAPCSAARPKRSGIKRSEMECDLTFVSMYTGTGQGGADG